MLSFGNRPAEDTEAFRAGVLRASDVAPWHRPEPRLWGLWDMLHFMAGHFVAALDLLGKLRQDASQSCLVGNEHDPIAAEILAKRISPLLELLERHCKSIELTAAAQYLERVRITFRTDADAGRVLKECETIFTLIHNDLVFHRFAYVPKRKAVLLDGIARDWDPVIQKFPSVRVDAHFGTECYALGMETASVFHMMLVLEPGLKALAKALKVRTSVASWGPIIDRIEAAIGKLPPSGKSKKRAALVTFYAEAAKEFRYFKDAWRNHTAHGRADYDENDALKVLTHVREFMLHISTRLKEAK